MSGVGFASGSVYSVLWRFVSRSISSKDRSASSAVLVVIGRKREVGSRWGSLRNGLCVRRLRVESVLVDIVSGEVGVFISFLFLPFFGSGVGGG
jgi:hypothetical protein